MTFPLQDEYIHMNNIKTPIHSYKSQNLNDQTDSGVSKFDRYKHQDEDDEDMDEGNLSCFHSFFKQF